MKTHYYFYGLLGMSCLYFSQTHASQPKSSSVSPAEPLSAVNERIRIQREKNKQTLGKIEPTLEQVRDRSVPWGLNLDKVEERGRKVRAALSGGGDDFSSQITLYQKHKGIDKSLRAQYEALLPDYRKAQADAASLNPAKVISRSRNKRILQDIQAKMDTLKVKLKSNQDLMEKFENSIMLSTGISYRQVTSLPAIMGKVQTIQDTSPKNRAGP